MPPQHKTRIAVVGAGAFGRNHARVYHELAQQDAALEFVAVVDANVGRAKEVARQFGAQAFATVAGLKGKVDAATVAVPTVAHLEVAQQLMRDGIDVLIEKPVASSLREADELIKLARQHQRIAQVGHLERFNPAVRATAKLITKPMFFEVHRLSVFTPRALDVDVVLDLMIHDLDIVLSFVDSPVKEVRAVGLPILSDKVDIANVRMEFDSGCVANFTASRVSTERIRKLRFFQPHQYVSLDYTRQDVVVFTVGDGKGEAPPPAPGLAEVDAARHSSAHPSGPEIRPFKPEVTHEEPLHAELRAFLHAVRTRTQPVVPLEEGRRALAVALEILAAIRDHSRRIGF
ncbi:MAG: Gfo/Idh/MocA family oxidoreductase [Acidobacteriota bacterium]|nr:Gfo/Idh/MocA family oxidoreductase [Acidobacteriota bacterium]